MVRRKNQLLEIAVKAAECPDGSHSETVRVAATCFGVTVAVACPRRYALVVAACFPCNSTPTDSTERTKHHFSIEADPEVSGRFVFKRGRVSLGPSQLLTPGLKLLQKEIYWTVAEHSSTHVIIHAGVVAWDNCAVVLPGSTHHGKSTLVWS